jgi:hypothetical protein
MTTGKKMPDIQNPDTLSKLADSLIEKMFGQKGVLDYIDLQELKKQGLKRLKEGKKNKESVAATIMEAYGKAKAAAKKKDNQKEDDDNKETAEPMVIFL